MIELPEATTLAAQAGASVVGRTVVEAEVNRTPHRLTGFFGDATSYPRLLTGRTFTGARGVAGHVRLEAGDLRLVLNDCAQPRWYAAGVEPPDRHQLRLALDDGSTLLVTVGMYGGIQVFREGENDNPYYRAALTAPSPLTPACDAAWFDGLLDDVRAHRLSLKAVLATGQRIPGLGNGALQDILWVAGLHPRRKVGSLSPAERARLYDAVVATLRAMADGGGRDTERDLFGRPGGYATVMSRLHRGEPCPRCGGRRSQASYLGGTVDVCEACQPAQGAPDAS